MAEWEYIVVSAAGAGDHSWRMQAAGQCDPPSRAGRLATLRGSPSFPGMIHVVWFKRDLRAADHAPLADACAAAAGAGAAVLPLYLAEPEYWALPDTGGRHWAFIAESLAELRAELAARGQPLVVRIGGAVDVLDGLHRTCGIAGLWSHQETGNAWTFDRDRAVAAWARAAGVPWVDWPQSGVVRGLKSRDGWARHWDVFMARPMVSPPVGIPPAAGIEPGPIPSASALGLGPDPCPGRQPGGRAAALSTLDSFLERRGRRYHREMSSPVTAFDACSRLSAPLAYGCLSMREVAQATRTAQETAHAPGADPSWRPALDAVLGRLHWHWHCHFIQKLEDRPESEWRNVHPAYDGLRERVFDRTLFEAWRNGLTGLPFVDACMRALAATGWINFRMRAMLAAVAGYHLWLHWREPGEHLARLFTDYEPGIHWNQMQMQSGTTGINTVRIYNPVKQGRDHDPDGRFTHRWVPELAGVDDRLLHEPWRMDRTQQRSAGCVLGREYPEPVVDHLAAARLARERIWAARRGPAFKAEADRIQARHGSRRSGLPSSTAPRRGRDDRQLGFEA